jgi:hypothetical protein
MSSAGCEVRSRASLMLAFTGWLVASAAAADSQAPLFTTETLRGRVIFLTDEMEKRTDARPVPEAKDRILGLQASNGQVIPLLEDVRGRAFRNDERLRQMEVELLVRRYRNWPLVQILRVFELKDGSRYEIDYWCDICAIAIYEDRECDCCQGPVVLRRQKIE